MVFFLFTTSIGESQGSPFFYLLTIYNFMFIHLVMVIILFIFIEKILIEGEIWNT
jgi:hypothetical protein